MTDDARKQAMAIGIALQDAYADGVKDGLEEVAALRARIQRLEAAAKLVEKWWLDEGNQPFDGAPYAIFALREALEDECQKS